MGKTVAGPAPMACVACGRRGGLASYVGRSPQLWVLRRGEVHVAQAYKTKYIVTCLWVGLLSLGSMG
jgi:hypothetical protein